MSEMNMPLALQAFIFVQFMILGVAGLVSAVFAWTHSISRSYGAWSIYFVAGAGVPALFSYMMPF